MAEYTHMSWMDADDDHLSVLNTLFSPGFKLVKCQSRRPNDLEYWGIPVAEQEIDGKDENEDSRSNVEINNKGVDECPNVVQIQLSQLNRKEELKKLRKLGTENYHVLNVADIVGQFDVASNLNGNILTATDMYVQSDQCSVEMVVDESQETLLLPETIKIESLSEHSFQLLKSKKINVWVNNVGVDIPVNDEQKLSSENNASYIDDISDCESDVQFNDKQCYDESKDISTKQTDKNEVSVNNKCMNLPSIVEVYIDVDSVLEHVHIESNVKSDVPKAKLLSPDSAYDTENSDQPCYEDVADRQEDSNVASHSLDSFGSDLCKQKYSIETVDIRAETVETFSLIQNGIRNRCYSDIKKAKSDAQVCRKSKKHSSNESKCRMANTISVERKRTTCRGLDTNKRDVLKEYTSNNESSNNLMEKTENQSKHECSKLKEKLPFRGNKDVERIQTISRTDGDKTDETSIVGEAPEPTFTDISIESMSKELKLSDNVIGNIKKDHRKHKISKVDGVFKEVIATFDKRVYGSCDNHKVHEGLDTNKRDVLKEYTSNNESSNNQMEKTENHKNKRRKHDCSKLKEKLPFRGNKDVERTLTISRTDGEKTDETSIIGEAPEPTITDIAKESISKELNLSDNVISKIKKDPRKRKISKVYEVFKDVIATCDKRVNGSCDNLKVHNAESNHTHNKEHMCNKGKADQKQDSTRHVIKNGRKEEPTTIDNGGLAKSGCLHKLGLLFNDKKKTEGNMSSRSKPVIEKGIINGRSSESDSKKVIEESTKPTFCSSNVSHNKNNTSTIGKCDTKHGEQNHKQCEKREKQSKYKHVVDEQQVIHTEKQFKCENSKKVAHDNKYTKNENKKHNSETILAEANATRRHSANKDRIENQENKTNLRETKMIKSKIQNRRKSEISNTQDVSKKRKESSVPSIHEELGNDEKHTSHSNLHHPAKSKRTPSSSHTQPLKNKCQALLLARETEENSETEGLVYKRIKQNIETCTSKPQSNNVDYANAYLHEHKASDNEMCKKNDIDDKCTDQMKRKKKQNKLNLSNTSSMKGEAKKRVLKWLAEQDDSEDSDDIEPLDNIFTAMNRLKFKIPKRVKVIQKADALHNFEHCENTHLSKELLQNHIVNTLSRKPVLKIRRMNSSTPNTRMLVSQSKLSVQPSSETITDSEIAKRCFDEEMKDSDNQLKAKYDSEHISQRKSQMNNKHSKNDDCSAMGTTVTMHKLIRNESETALSLRRIDTQSELDHNFVQSNCPTTNGLKVLDTVSEVLVICKKDTIVESNVNKIITEKETKTDSVNLESYVRTKADDCRRMHMCEICNRAFFRDKRELIRHKYLKHSEQNDIHSITRRRVEYLSSRNRDRCSHTDKPVHSGCHRKHVALINDRKFVPTCSRRVESGRRVVCQADSSHINQLMSDRHTRVRNEIDESLMQQQAERGKNGMTTQMCTVCNKVYFSNSMQRHLDIAHTQETNKHVLDSKTIHGVNVKNKTEGSQLHERIMEKKNVTVPFVSKLENGNESVEHREEHSTQTESVLAELSTSHSGQTITNTTAKHEFSATKDRRSTDRVINQNNTQYRSEHSSNSIWHISNKQTSRLKADLNNTGNSIFYRNKNNIVHSSPWICRQCKKGFQLKCLLKEHIQVADHYMIIPGKYRFR